MKRYLITSPKFSGQAELIYNEGQLIHIALLDALMAPQTAQAFLRCVSVKEDEIAAKFSNETTIVAAEVEITFDMFWKEYAEKRNRARSLKLWDKLSHTDKAHAYMGIRPYKKYLKKVDWRSIADPDTYLRNRYWENEY